MNAFEQLENQQAQPAANHEQSIKQPPSQNTSTMLNQQQTGVSGTPQQQQQFYHNQFDSKQGSKGPHQTNAPAVQLHNMQQQAAPQTLNSNQNNANLMYRNPQQFAPAMNNQFAPQANGGFNPQQSQQQRVNSYGNQQNNHHHSQYQQHLQHPQQAFYSQGRQQQQQFLQHNQGPLAVHQGQMSVPHHQMNQGSVQKNQQVNQHAPVMTNPAMMSQPPLQVQLPPQSFTQWGKPIQRQEVNAIFGNYMNWVTPLKRPLALQMERNRDMSKGALGIKEPSLKSNIDQTNQSNQDANDGATSTENIQKSQQYKDLLRINPAAAAAMKTNVKCPERLNSYIERAFSKCINDVERDFMVKSLLEITSASQGRGDLFIKQWEHLPLPLLQRESQQHQQVNERLKTGQISDQITQNPQKMMQQLQQNQQMTRNMSQQSANTKNNGFSQQMAPADKQGQQSSFSFQMQGGSQQAAQNQNTQNHQQKELQEIQYPANGEQSFATGGAQNASMSQNGNNVNNQFCPSNIQSQSKLPSFVSSISQKQQSFMSPQPGSMIDRKLLRMEKLAEQTSGGRQGSNKKPSLLSQNSTDNQNNGETNNNDLESLTQNLIVQGTCQQIEKSYFRLTQAPDPSEVRPEIVLKKTLRMLKLKWKNQTSDYKYIDDQFRSMRQDLTVQHIQDEFCLKVYEAHARIALEQADMDQFNQCQTQLKYLYAKGLKGNEIEFKGYQFLYYIFCELDTDIAGIMKTLTAEEKVSPPIQHALKVRSALVQGNFSRFFKLYTCAPHLGSYLIDVFIDKHRVLCLQKLAMGYISTGLDLEYLTTLMAFDDVDVCSKFLTEMGCKIADNKLDCRLSLNILKQAPLKIRRCKK